MSKPLNTAVEKGWRIELLGPNGWTSINEHPFHKIRAVNAARTWRRDFKRTSSKLRVRIVQVRVTTETLAQKEIR